ncbi:MAG: cache domain-containing protein [Nitrospinota bacterium]|nr:cache domain-containing protein [Nitrospinota bacterium]
MKRIALPLFTLFLIPAIFCLYGCSPTSGHEVKSETFEKLRSVRRERKLLVVQKLERMRGRVKDSVNNSVLTGAFDRFRSLLADGALPAGTGAYEDKDLDQEYLEKYYNFYDILFIDRDGLVFHTMRRESDLGKNIFNSDISSTLLAQTLKSGTLDDFVDYHYYSPSREPAAFFIAPMKRPDGLSGWIVFQLSSGALRDIMSQDTSMGKTAEVYLTNESHVMLTQSRLLPQDTVMNLRVETEAVRRAMEAGEGDGVILDYRGVRVFSSFEKFQFAGVGWVIIAEMDEDEVITRQFMDDRDRLYNEIFKRLPAGTTAEPHPELLYQESVRVDINEYGSGRVDDVISTAGVTTCTAVVIQYPGKFAFLGHIYPLDDVYFEGWEKYILGVYYGLFGSVHGDRVADLMGRMLHEITYFNIHPSETRRLEAVLLATHRNSFRRITDRLLDTGLLLSQIRIVTLDGMKYLDVAVEVDKASVVAHWVGPGGKKEWTNAAGAPTLDVLVKDIIGYDSQGPV